MKVDNKLSNKLNIKITKRKQLLGKKACKIIETLGGLNYSEGLIVLNYCIYWLVKEQQTEPKGRNEREEIKK